MFAINRTASLVTDRAYSRLVLGRPGEAPSIVSHSAQAPRHIASKADRHRSAVSLAVPRCPAVHARTSHTLRSGRKSPAPPTTQADIGQ